MTVGGRRWVGDGGWATVSGRRTVPGVEGDTSRAGKKEGRILSRVQNMPMKASGQASGGMCCGTGNQCRSTVYCVVMPKRNTALPKKSNYSGKSTPLAQTHTRGLHRA